MPSLQSGSSVTIHNWSSGFGRVIERDGESAFSAAIKALRSPSVHEMFSVDGSPTIAPSKGARIDEHSVITCAKTLYAPMNDFICLPSLESDKRIAWIYDVGLLRVYLVTKTKPVSLWILG
jgi:hypothetical protein